MKKTQKYESSIAANVLLVLWEGITPEELLRLVIKRELYCDRELSISPLDNTPKSVKDLLNETDPYIFSGNAIESYEKLHREVLVKPEPKTQKEVIPPYLDGNNPNFAPELALAIRLWESIAKGEFDKGKSWQAIVETYLKENLPKSIRITSEMIDRFTTIISKKPKSLSKGIEAIKGKFIPSFREDSPL